MKKSVRRTGKNDIYQKHVNFRRVSIRMPPNVVMWNEAVNRSKERRENIFFLSLNKIRSIGLTLKRS